MDAAVTTDVVADAAATTMAADCLAAADVAA